MKQLFNFILLTVLLAPVVSLAQTKYVVIEGGTGTWCGACTGAIGKMRAIKRTIQTSSALKYTMVIPWKMRSMTWLPILWGDHQAM